MNSQLDLNIDKYTKEELIKLLGLQQPINEEKVTQAIGALLDGYTQKYPVNQNILQFFFDMKQKLLKKELTDYEIQRKKQEEEEEEKEKNLKKTLPNLKLPKSDVYTDGGRPVVIHEDLKTLPTFNQEYVGGEMNPVKKRIITKLFPIDTRYRLDYNTTKSTDFSIQLPDTIKNVVSMKLNSFEFPVTNYNLSETLDTNTFSIIYNGTATLITILQGNYTADELKNFLYNSIAGTGVFYDPPFNGNVGVEFDSKYGKFIIELTTAGIAAGDTIALDFNSVKFLNRDIKYNLGWMLGYRKDSYSGLQRYVPEGIYDTAGTRNINLLVNDFNNNNGEVYVNPFWSGPMKYNILARIQQPAATNEIIFNDNSDLQYKAREYFGPVDIKRLQIQILNDNFEVIDNNNMDYSLTLEFKCIYNL